MAIDETVTTFPHDVRNKPTVHKQQLWQMLKSVYYFLYKTIAGYIMILFCISAICMINESNQLNDCFPALLWPMNLYTGMMLLALIFPVSAILYFMFNLSTRFDEIKDAARRAELYYVYFSEMEKELSSRQFNKMLVRRFKEYYNPFELAAFSLMAGALAFTLQFLLAKQTGLGIDPLDPSEISEWGLLIMAGFYGALAGAFLLIVKKYRTFDIYPSTYLHAAVALAVGTFAGAALSAGVIAIPKGTSMALFIFTIGFFTATHASFLGEFLRNSLAKQVGVRLPPSIGTDLNRVIQNSDAIESLNALSLNSISELTMSEPMILYLNMPQPLGVINGWIDRALLHFYLENWIDTLHKVNIERFTQLVNLLAVDIQSNKIIWEDQISITGNTEVDDQIQRTVKNIVQSRLHHRLLGILWEKYRKTFFLSQAQTQ